MTASLLSCAVAWSVTHSNAASTVHVANEDADFGRRGEDIVLLAEKICLGRDRHLHGVVESRPVHGFIGTELSKQVC